MSTSGEPPTIFTQPNQRLLGRLPLVLFLVVSLAAIWYLDGRLVSEDRGGALTQAARTDALLEGELQQRVTLLRSLRRLVSEVPGKAERDARFRSFAREMRAAVSDLHTVYRLDAAGRTLDRFPPASSDDARYADNHLILAELGDALARARDTRETAISGVVPLRPDTLGLLVYDPIRDADGRIAGYVAVEIAYAELLSRVLTGGPQGRFGYRITDAVGTVLAVSPDYPERITEFVHRSIGLPSGKAWHLDIAIEPFQPLLSRVILWVVGLLLLALVVVIVVRERARTDHFQRHSVNLELLSRNLLEANVRLEERARQVTAANQAKSRFLGNVSHELRTPINAIVGYNSLALGGLYGEISAKLRLAHDRIGAASNHLLGLVNDVLDLSKIEAGRMEVENEPVDLETLLRDVVSVIEPAADAKGVRVDLVTPPEMPVVTTDATHVRQIMLNLVSNAIKFTSDGFVTVIVRRGTEAEAGTLRLDVEDTGIGVDRHDLDRIFEEFEQVRPGGRGDSLKRGTGLGLAVSRKLARLLGGDVVAQSLVGSGSRFTLVLPWVEAGHPEPIPDDAGTRRGPASGPNPGSGEPREAAPAKS